MTRKRTMHGFVVALVASLALGLVGVASASAATQHWYVNGTKLAEGTPVNIKMENTSKTFNVTAEYNGQEKFINVTCLHQSIKNGTIENPAGGGAGKATSGGVGGGAFAISKPCTGCATGSAGDFFYMWEAQGAAVEFEGKPALRLSPPGGGNLFGEIQLCGIYSQLEGSLTGVQSGSSFVYSASSSAELKWSKRKMVIAGTSKIETSTGQSVTLAP